MEDDRQLKPCPKCGSRFVAKGKPIKITTPKVLRIVLCRIGATCVCCGYRSLSIKAWNRRATRGT